MTGCSTPVVLKRVQLRVTWEHPTFIISNQITAHTKRWRQINSKSLKSQNWQGHWLTVLYKDKVTSTLWEDNSFRYSLETEDVHKQKSVTIMAASSVSQKHCKHLIQNYKWFKYENRHIMVYSSTKYCRAKNENVGSNNFKICWMKNV